MTLDDLRRLNYREIGNWPLLPKIGVLFLLFIAIVAAGAFFDWKDQFEVLDKTQTEEGKLREQFAQKKAKAVNYDLYVAQLKEVEQSFGALVKQLPNRSEIDALLTDINQAGLGRGLQFELFKPGQVVVKDYYAELPIDIKVTGHYHDIGEFAADMAKMPRIVTLNNLALTAGKDGTLSLDAVAKTFRYLDQEELDAQAKARKTKKSKDGKEAKA